MRSHLPGCTPMQSQCPETALPTRTNASHHFYGVGNSHSDSLIENCVILFFLLAFPNQSPVTFSIKNKCTHFSFTWVQFPRTKMNINTYFYQSKLLYTYLFTESKIKFYFSCITLFGFTFPGLTF